MLLLNACKSMRTIMHLVQSSLYKNPCIAALAAICIFDVLYYSGVGERSNLHTLTDSCSLSLFSAGTLPTTSGQERKNKMKSSAQRRERERENSRVTQSVKGRKEVSYLNMCAVILRNAPHAVFFKHSSFLSCSRQ